jgi:hypothetical protein
LETRLKLRALLARKKAEQFANANFLERVENDSLEKENEKKKILDKLKQNEQLNT